MLIVVLGGGIDLKGNLPAHVYQRLDKAIELYRKYIIQKSRKTENRDQKTDKSDNQMVRSQSSNFSHLSSGTSDIRIALSGKYSFLYYDQKPPITEARKMSEYLVKNNIPKRNILLETRSKDSIGNAYYLKKNVFIPRDEDKAVIITSTYHIERVRFIISKIFGHNYQFEFHPVKEKFTAEEEKQIIKRQKELLLKTKEILANMKDGDHNYLKWKLYHIKFYKEKRPNWIVDFASKGKLK